MKYLDGKFHVESKDHRCEVHPTDNFILRERRPPRS